MSLEGDHADAEEAAAWVGGGVACCAPAIVSKHVLTKSTAIKRLFLSKCINRIASGLTAVATDWTTTSKIQVVSSTLAVFRMSRLPCS
jgi:hypothetical protein